MADPARPRLLLVPKESVTGDDIAAAALDHDWWIHRVRKESPREVIYRTDDAATTIHWIEDHKTGIPYISVMGANLNAVGGQVRDSVPTYSLDEVRALVERAATADERVRAICYLGLAAPDAFDAAIFAVFERYLDDEDRDVRQAAVLATLYVGWPELIAPLRRCATGDAEAVLRQQADAIVRWMLTHPPRC
jgi:hypothetical protein